MKIVFDPICGQHIHSYWSICIPTRMHSSGMRTGRSLTICWSLLPRGCLLPGGCLLWGGVCSRGCLLCGVSAPMGGVISQHALRQTPPPINRITDTSKNITLATTSLWPVIILTWLPIRVCLHVKFRPMPWPFWIKKQTFVIQLNKVAWQCYK